MSNPQIPSDVGEIVAFALREDIGSGDITAQLIPAQQHARASIIAREPGILCGIPWVNDVFRQLDPAAELHWSKSDGDRIDSGDRLLQIDGAARAILSGERTALNFLQTLSGTATLASQYARAVAHTPVRLLDTRKTLPGLRRAQKYAVATGGCYNHRIGLFDAFLIKENHIAAAGSIVAAVTAASRLYPDRDIEVEVQNLEQLEAAIGAGAGSVLLDNFSVEQLREAVSVNAGRVKLEASGGIDEARLVSIAETGVDFISIGALTKNCRALDLTLLMQVTGES
ncbi:MAG: carboxylating nicotinate-nucleotide diphosphorylase [Gammaproteobacteria bacterium]